MVCPDFFQDRRIPVPTTMKGLLVDREGEAAAFPRVSRVGVFYCLVLRGLMAMWTGRSPCLALATTVSRQPLQPHPHVHVT
jgi:hypothetical protein